MYSTLAIRKNPKKGKSLVGTHQKLDRVARKVLVRILPKDADFPTSPEIVYFEGMRGPDGIKRKSPGVDEPVHFIILKNDDGVLWRTIEDHQYNLREALKKKDRVRAAFEAAWMAHAITDGLTPAHHFPLKDATEELMSEKEFVKIFGEPIKGIMRGENALETARNNWLYWGAGGYMSKHIAFEYGVALMVAAMPYRKMMPKLKKKELKSINLKKEFYAAVKKIDGLDMYGRFQTEGWSPELAVEVRKILIPEIVRLIVLGWLSCL